MHAKEVKVFIYLSVLGSVGTVLILFLYFCAEHPELLDVQSEKDEKLLARLIGANVIPEKIQVRVI